MPELLDIEVFTRNLKKMYAGKNNLWPARAITCNSLGVINILTCIVYHIRVILPDG